MRPSLYILGCLLVFCIGCKKTDPQGATGVTGPAGTVGPAGAVIPLELQRQTQLSRGRFLR